MITFLLAQAAEEASKLDVNTIIGGVIATILLGHVGLKGHDKFGKKKNGNGGPGCAHMLGHQDEYSARQHKDRIDNSILDTCRYQRATYMETKASRKVNQQRLKIENNASGDPDKDAAEVANGDTHYFDAVLEEKTKE